MPAILGLLILTFIAFAPSLFNGFINWDDYLLLVNNPLIISSYGHHLSEFFTIAVGKTYIPLTMLSFFVEHHFFKMNPFVYHLDNLLLHFIVVLFVYKICLRLGLSLRASFLAAALFSIHPMRVESISWIAERKDVLYSCFYVLAIYQYLLYLQTFKKARYALSLLFCILSLLSKPMALSLPLILLLLDWFTKRKLSRQSLLEKLPFVIFSIFFAHITYSFFAPVGIKSIFEALLIWSWTFMFYIYKFALPFHLSPIYWLPKPIVISNVEYLNALAGFSIFIISLVYFKKNRLWIFACGYYILSIFFLLHFNTSNEIMPVADRYMYLPSLGFCLFIGLSIDGLINNRDDRSRKLLYGVVIFIFIGLMSKTLMQCRIWKNEFIFWTAINTESPSYLSFMHLGDCYEQQGDHQRAIEYYTKALGGKPDYDFWLYQNIGIVYLAQKYYAQALKFFDQSLKLNPRSPEAYMLKASVNEAQNDHESAFENYSKAIEYNPYFAQAFHNRAIIYCRRGQLDLAITDLTQAIKIIPDFLTAYYLRGQIYGIMGEKAKALDDFNIVLKIKPNYAATDNYILLLKSNNPIPHHLDIPNDTYDQPQWNPTGYKNYLPDRDRVYKLEA